MTDSNNNPVNEKSSSSKNMADEVASKPNAPGVFGVMQSVLAAMFGVQSEEKRKQDFESGSAGSYIFVGIVMVIIFVLTIIYIVNTILEQSAK